MTTVRRGLPPKPVTHLCHPKGRLIWVSSGTIGHVAQRGFFLESKMSRKTVKSQIFGAQCSYSSDFLNCVCQESGPYRNACVALDIGGKLPKDVSGIFQSHVFERRKIGQLTCIDLLFYELINSLQFGDRVISIYSPYQL